jgi:hypothetical protein
MHEFDISFYARFKDDVLIIFHDFRKLKEFIKILKIGHPFSIKCDSISSTEVDFLEVRVCKGTQFSVFPVSKPSTLSSPWLSRHSAHPPNVLHAWPLARLKTRLGLCSNRRLKQLEKSSFIKRAQSQMLSARSIQALDCQPQECGSSMKTYTGSTRWLVLPFYPVLLKTGFCVNAHNFWSSDFVGRLLEGFHVRLSFCNVLKNVAQFSKSYWR